MGKIISFMCLCVSSLAFGQAIETDRPDQTESSAVLPLNAIQIETGIGVEFIEHFDTGARESTIFAPTTLFRISVKKGFELRLVNTLEHHKADLLSPNESRGWHIDDLQIGTKIQLYNRPSAKTQVAIMQHVAMPTSLSASTSWGSITKLLVSHKLDCGLSIAYNLGYDVHQSEVNVFTYSAALGIPINEIIGSYIEVFGDYWFKERPLVNMDAGLTFAIGDSMQIDYSFGIGLTQLMNYQAIGFSLRLPH